MVQDFEYQVLNEVARRHGNSYAFPIAEAISEAKEKRITLGAVHTVLARLEKKGFVTSRIDTPSEEHGARPRRYYKITGLGAEALAARERTVLQIYGSALAGVIS